MNDQPEVSVLMVVYNQEPYIAAAIESVLSSTYTDFEFIIVDDCSTDQTVSIIRAYEQKDERIKFIANQQNLGQFANRNKAAALAKGKYIKYFDSDDIMYPNCIEIMIRSMHAFPEAGMGMVYGLDLDIPFPVLFSSHKAYAMHFFENKGMMVGPPGSIFKKEAFDKAGGFSGTPYASDYELNLTITAVMPYVAIQPGLFFYRVHAGQGMYEGNQNNGYKVNTYKVQQVALRNEKCPLSATEVNRALRMINKLQARRALGDLLKYRKINRFKQIVFDSGLGWKQFIKGLVSFK